MTQLSHNEKKVIRERLNLGSDQLEDLLRGIKESLVNNSVKETIKTHLSSVMTT